VVKRTDIAPSRHLTPARVTIGGVPVAPFAWMHEKTQVEFDGQALTINSKQLPLDQIERLSRELSRSTAQGSWNRLDCGVNLFANGEVASVSFRGDASTEEWGPWRPLWDQLDTLVRHEIEPRLLERTIRQVAVGSRAEIVSFRAKGRGIFTVTAESLQARKLFSKPIPWKAITEMPGVHQIITTDPDGKRRKHNTGLISSEWDAWQIPLLWHHFAAQ
jgi:hypothetical protein